MRPTPPNEESPTGFGPATWIGALAVLGALTAAFFLLAPRDGGDGDASAVRAAEPAPRVIPPFELESSSGEQVALADLRGRPWVVEFFFTSCPICALMNRGFQRLQRELPPDVRLVSITVDPEHDTREALQSYAARHEADPARWLFLRGELAAVCDLMEQGFGYARAATPALHSLRFALIDAEGRLVQSYAPIEFDANDEQVLSDEVLSKLVRDAAALLPQPSGR
jgi:protein SCO1/2